MRVMLVVLSLSLLGCAHGKTRGRARVALVLVGGGSVVLGALATSGCEQNMTGCGGGPDNANLALGIPLLVAGTVMIATGVLMGAGPAPKPRPGTLIPSRGY